ncbi:MAG: anti-sigma factor family protein [Myxococcaceae bacterium]
MSCSFEEDLTAYVDGELSEVRAQAVKQHLAGCADCRMVEGMIRRTASAMGTLPAFEPSPELRRRVMRHLEPAPSLLGAMGKWLRPQVLLPIAGLAALGGIVFAVHGADKEPLEVTEPAQLELAMNMDELEDFDVVGLDGPDDVDVIEHLDELQEVKP